MYEQVLLIVKCKSNNHLYLLWRHASAIECLMYVMTKYYQNYFDIKAHSYSTGKYNWFLITMNNSLNGVVKSMALW